METPDRHLDGDSLCDYAEGALDAHAQATAEAHLQACPDCLRELQVVRGYFREMTGLEAVKAPANFLAKVRMRLPQPSPWKTFLLGCMRPVRAIPMQIAVLTVLGITVITAYLYERGGSLPETQTMIPYPAAKAAGAESPSLPEAVQEKNGFSTKAEAGGEEISDQTPSPGIGKRKASRLASSARPSAAPKAAEAPSPVAADKPAVSAPAPAALPSSEPIAAPATQALKDAMDMKGEDAAAGYIASPDRDESKNDPDKTLNRQKTISAQASQSDRLASGSNPAPGESLKKARGGNEASRISEEESDRLDARPAVPIQEIRLQLRKAEMGVPMLAGLKAMGVEVSPQADRGLPLYRLRVPASMVAELKPYLERYGTLGLQAGPIPTHATAPISFDLRVAPPAK
jgi:hypothetical protein